VREALCEQSPKFNLLYEDDILDVSSKKHNAYNHKQTRALTGSRNVMYHHAVYERASMLKLRRAGAVLCIVLLATTSLSPELEGEDIGNIIFFTRAEQAFWAEIPCWHERGRIFQPRTPAPKVLTG